MEESVSREVKQIPVVGNDVNGMGGSFQEWSPVLEGHHDGQKLFVVNWVSTFHWRVFLRVDGNWV